MRGTKSALNMGSSNHTAKVRESFVVEVVVLRRLFIANSRAKCDRRDYDRCRRPSRSSRGNIVQPNERSALLCSVSVRSFVSAAQELFELAHGTGRARGTRLLLLLLLP